MLYIIMFLLSLALVAISLHFRYKNKRICIFFLVLGIIVPCLLAAFRDFSIGTDVWIYQLPAFYDSGKFTSFSAYLEGKASSITEVLYLALTYICRIISQDPGLLFFSISLLCMVPFCIAVFHIFKSKERNPSRNEQKALAAKILLSFFIYFMTFYNATYNLARQCIAISFSTLALSYLLDKKYKHVIIFSCIAFLFHRTALLIVPVELLYILLESRKISDKRKGKIKILISAFIALLVCLTPVFVNMIVNLNIGSLKFQKQLVAAGGKVDFNFTDTLFYIILYVTFIVHDRIFPNLKNNVYFRYLAFLNIIILQFGAFIRYSHRMGYYILFPLLFLGIPKLLPDKFQNRKEHVYVALIVIIFIAYWALQIIIRNHHGTFPYIMRAVF